MNKTISIIIVYMIISTSFVYAGDYIKYNMTFQYPMWDGRIGGLGHLGRDDTLNETKYGDEASLFGAIYDGYVQWNVSALNKYSNLSSVWVMQSWEKNDSWTQSDKIFYSTFNGTYINDSDPDALVMWTYVQTQKYVQFSVTSHSTTISKLNQTWVRPYITNTSSQWFSIGIGQNANAEDRFIWSYNKRTTVIPQKNTTLIVENTCDLNNASSYWNITTYCYLFNQTIQIKQPIIISNGGTLYLHNSSLDFTGTTFKNRLKVIGGKLVIKEKFKLLG